MDVEAIGHVLMLDEETRDMWLLSFSRANLYETVGSGRKGGGKEEDGDRPPSPSLNTQG